MISASASKIRDSRSSIKKECSYFTNRRSVSVDTRSRGSYVPEKKRATSDERKSGNRYLDIYNRGSGARKSSINTFESKQKDVRPLTNKQYQKRKMADLIAFLDENGFSYQIKESKLFTLSKKDFENIFQFLYNILDPSYEVKKIEEEAPKILKNLGYPFVLSKQAFMYVARTHWPSLLGVLIWLMDLSKFALNINIQSTLEFAGGDKKRQVQAILLRFICQCYHSGKDDEEAENKVFKSIVTSLMTEDVEELIVQNNKKKELLSSVEEQLSEIQSLIDKNSMYGDNIVKYEEYIIKLRSHYQKKNELVVQLEDELKKKESELKKLQDEAAKKQDAYDAQGFDGKKQLKFFEIQKKELTEKLEKKQTVHKEIQDRIWEAEIQYNNNLDKINAASESFNELYNSALEDAKTILQSLQNFQAPQIQKLCDSFYQECSSWKISPWKNTPDWKIDQDNILESIANRVETTKEIFKKFSSSQNEKLSEIQQKISDVLNQEKLLSAEEFQMEHDCNFKEKEAADKLSSLEAQCDKSLKSVLALQSETVKFKTKYKEMSNELTALQKIQKEKQKDLNDYLAEQKEVFEFCSKTEEDISKLVLFYGDEIYNKLEELLPKK